MGYEYGHRVTPIDGTIWQSFFGMGLAAGALLFGYSRKRAIEHRSIMV
jgi:LPXTG-motif cell wall-anchored protein